MSALVVLLRGINLGPNNRIAMGALREALEQAGFPGARTYVQSGNIVLDSATEPDAVGEAVHALIAERFGLTIPVAVRSRDQLAEVVARNPLRDVATEPKLHQVTFLSAAPDPAAVERLESVCTERERVVVIGRELYSWHPDGVARSKLALGLANKQLGAAATARNWRTVTTLLEMADER